MDDDVEPYTDLPPLARFRFRLRTMFVIVTIVCLLLGLKLASEARRARIMARHNALIDTLVVNVLSPPTNTTYQTSVGDANEVAGSFNFNEVDFKVHFLDARGGGRQRVSGRTFVLNISKMPPATNSADIGRLLIEHYEKGLSRLGMKQGQSAYGIGLDGRQSRCVWRSEDYDLIAVIDVEVSAKRGLAEVRILVIDGQSQSLW